jgi:hypothetical protein
MILFTILVSERAFWWGDDLGREGDRGDIGDAGVGVGDRGGGVGDRGVCVGDRGVGVGDRGVGADDGVGGRTRIDVGIDIDIGVCICSTMADVDVDVDIGVGVGVECRAGAVTGRVILWEKCFREGLGLGLILGLGL